MPRLRPRVRATHRSGREIDWPISRLHFNAVVEQFALVYDSNKGLILSEVQSEYWHAENRPFQIDGFSQVVVKQRGITYAASNVSIAALTDDEIRWIVEMPFFQTTPIDIRIVDDVLYVGTSNGHAYSVKKADGEWVFHHTEELVGHSLVDEIIELAIDEVAKTNDGHYRLHKHIAALAALEDECAAPLLIECVHKGAGYPEKAMAVAALQRILGDKAGWHDPFTPGEARPRPAAQRAARQLQRLVNWHYSWTGYLSALP